MNLHLAKQKTQFAVHTHPLSHHLLNFQQTAATFKSKLRSDYYKFSDALGFSIYLEESQSEQT